MSRKIARICMLVLLLGGALSALHADGEPTLGSMSATLIRVPLVRQSTGYTCGVASLVSVLSYYYSADPELRWVREDRLAAELGTTSEGTDHRHIAQVARDKGLGAEIHYGMKLDTLFAALDAGKPVIAAIQAWDDNSGRYKDYDDSGHYVVAIGHDAARLYFMDPSVLGNYAYIPISEFLDRWHDTDLDGVTPIVGLGIIFSSSRTPTYDPERILPIE